MSSKYNKSMLKEIREDIKNKDFKAVIQKCEEILVDEPNNYMALIFLGAAYQEKDKKQAAKYLKKALACASDPTVALQGLLNCAEIEEIPDILRKLLKLVPQKSLEYHNKLVAISNNNNLGICMEILEDETENFETSPEQKVSAWKSIAKILVKQSQVPDKWETLFENALKITSADKNSENHLECSKRYLKLLYKLKKLDELLIQASILHEQYPKDVYPLEWICKVYTENYSSNLIQFESRLNNPIAYYYDTLLELNENSILGLLSKATQHYENKEFVLAYYALLKTKALQPKNPLALNLLARTHMQIGAFGMAAQIWKQLNIKDTQYAECLSYSKSETDLMEAVDILGKNSDNAESIEIIAALIRAYSNLNQIEKAEEIFLKHKNSSNEQIRLLEIEFFMQPTEAIEELGKFSSSSVEKFYLYFVKGKKYLEIQDYEKSLTNILFATKERPYYSECFMLLGKIYFHLKDIQRARKCYEKCVNLNSQNETAVTNLSAIYRKLEEWDSNATLLENTVKNCEGNLCPWALFQLGLHYLSTEQFDQAIRAIQTVVRVDLNNILYWETLADAYQQRGSYTSAMKVNEKILELDSNNLMAKYQIATLKTTLRVYDESIQLFDEILSEHPDFVPALKGVADAHHGLAENLLSMRLLGRCRDHLQKAMNYLQKAFLIGKRNAVWLWRMIANILTMVGRLPESKAVIYVSGQLAGQEENDKVEIKGEELFKFAEKFYMFALKLQENDHLLWHEFALCYYYYANHIKDEDDKLNHFKSAVTVCKQAINLKPIRWENWNLLGVIFATKEVNDLPLSQHCFIKALNIDKRAAVVWSNLGALYLSLDDIKLANEAFRRAQQSNPNYPNAWIGQAIIAEKIGEEEESMDLFRHCTQLGFHTESAVGYAHWVCSVLSDPEKMKMKSYQYAIHQMHAIPVALDSITWYFNVEEMNSSIEALSYLGYLNYKQSLWKPAVRAYQIASKNANDSQQKDQMLCNLGYALLKDNRPHEAIEAFMSISEANLESAIGLALANSKAGNVEDSYSMYESALEWLANSETEKSTILMEMSAILYAVKGEAETKEILYQLLALSDVPIEALYFACALGIIHKDWELTEAVLDELKKHENNPKYVHHTAFLTAYYYSGIKQPKKGLIHLLQRIHIFPDKPLLRKVLSEYLLKHSSKAKKQMHIAASQIAQSIVPLGLIRSTTSIEAARALTVASIAAGNADVNRQRILAQSAIHLDPTYKEAWNSLQACQN